MNIDCLAVVLGWIVSPITLRTLPADKCKSKSNEAFRTGWRRRRISCRLVCELLKLSVESLFCQSISDEWMLKRQLSMPMAISWSWFRVPYTAKREAIEFQLWPILHSSLDSSLTAFTWAVGFQNQTALWRSKPSLPTCFPKLPPYWSYVICFKCTVIDVKVLPLGFDKIASVSCPSGLGGI